MQDLRQNSLLKVVLKTCALLTVVSLTGPGTRFLRHGEQRVGDVGQKAVQVKHVDLHGRGLWLRVSLMRPFVLPGLADLTLENISKGIRTLTGSVTCRVNPRSIH